MAADCGAGSTAPGYRVNGNDGVCITGKDANGGCYAGIGGCDAGPRIGAGQGGKLQERAETLEAFLNQLKGEVLAVIPYVLPTFRAMGATSRVAFLLIVERVA